MHNNNLKTFFLFPQKLVFESIGEKRVSHQNEAFVLNNQVEFKDALKIFNQKSIAFINIDSVLTETEWIDYVRSFRDDPDFAKVRIGILSFNPDKRLIDIYKNELKIECGYHILSSRNKQYEEDIITIVNKIRSREGTKILRLDCDRSDPIKFQIKEKSIDLKGNIESLSSAAMIVSLANEKMLVKGMELNNITLSYGDLNCKLIGTVIGNSQFNNKQFIIKFHKLFEDFHQVTLFKIIFTVLGNHMKELVK